MHRSLVLLAVVLAPLAIGTGWSGEERLALLGRTVTMTAERVPLDPADPPRRRVGALTFLGGVALHSVNPAFGGFSSLTVAGRGFTLLSDGGGVVRFRLGDDWRPRDVTSLDLPAGPQTGWTKSDRDSESMALGPDGRIWVGFENANEIWRYAPGFARAERGAKPEAMRKWRSNGGIESMTRLHDGRFLALSESPERGDGSGGRTGLVWAGDPTVKPRPALRFTYQPTPGYDPADVTELPDGRLLVLERRFQLPFTWSNRLILVPRDAVRAGAVIRGRSIAHLAAPLIHDNFEGVATTQERGATIVWLVSDDNQLFLQRSLLLKFRLDA